MRTETLYPSCYVKCDFLVDSYSLSFQTYNQSVLSANSRNKLDEALRPALRKEPLRKVFNFQNTSFPLQCSRIEVADVIKFKFNYIRRFRGD